MSTLPRRKTALPSQPFAGPVELALHPEHLREALALRAPEAPAAAMNDGGDDPLDDVEITSGGVAVVRVQGFLVDRSWWCANYVDLVATVKAALTSPRVRAVALSVESPGGMVAGLFDAMRALRAAKAAAGKRVVAHTSGGAFSAAYALASIADEIVVTDIAGVGSIGVIDQLVSRAGQLEAEGIDVRVIASGEEKTDGHQAVPISKGAEARKRARVMQLAAMLSAEVSAGRPTLTADAITALDAGVRYGRDAIAAGLADRVATLDDVIASLSAPATSNAPARPFGATSSPTTVAATSATPTRSSPMSEKLLALITAHTGETDADRQLGALQAALSLASRASAAEAELATLRAERAAERAAAEKAAQMRAFEAAIERGQADAKITPAEAAQMREAFGRGEVSLGYVEANINARPPIAALTEEHRATRPPATPPAPNSSRTSELMAKGYAALSWDERNELATLAPAEHERLSREWTRAGRPGAR